MKERPEDKSIVPDRSVLKDLFFELSHSGRLSLLVLISEKGRRHTEISKALNISPQETTRHLERLLSSGLVSKDVEGFFFPSHFGRLVLGFMPIFEFAVEHKDYFLTHSLEEIPQDFLPRLHELAKARFGKRALDGIFVAKEMFSEAREYMHVMSHYVMEASVPIVEEKVLSGVSFKILLGKEAIEQLKIPQTRGGKEEEQILEFRMLEKIGTTILQNERNALLCFPDADGNPDYTHAFRGDDKDFHDFCTDLFFYFWNKASEV